MVERNLAKVKVAGSRPVFRSKRRAERLFFLILTFRSWGSTTKGCSRGGTGRHAGLKILWLHGRTGSIPVGSTTKASEQSGAFFIKYGCKAEKRFLINLGAAFRFMLLNRMRIELCFKCLFPKFQPKVYKIRVRVNPETLKFSCHRSSSPYSNWDERKRGCFSAAFATQKKRIG